MSELQTRGTDYDTEYHIEVEGLTDVEHDKLHDALAQQVDISDSSKYGNTSDIWLQRTDMRIELDELKRFCLAAIGRFAKGTVVETVYVPESTSDSFELEDYESNVKDERVERMVNG